MAYAPVLIVDLSEKFGGVSVRVLDTARALMKEGNRPFSVATIKNSPLHKELVAQNLNPIPIGHHKSDPRVFTKLLTIIKEGGYQVVDAHNFQSQLWGMLAATVARVPNRISSVHTAYGYVPGGWRGKIQEQVLRFNVRSGCRFMTVSRSLADYLNELGAEDTRVKLIYNGIDLDKFTTTAQTRTSLRHSLGWNADTVVLTFVGRLVWQKGLDYLLEAAALATATHPQLRILLVGDGKKSEELKAQAKALQIDDNVHFMGYQSQIHDILRQSDGFVLSSRAEGLPFALLEATVHKLPLLLSDVDGMGELFRDVANMTACGDVPALADSMRWLVDNPQEAKVLGARAHSFVRQRLSPEIMTDETLALYEI